MGLRPEPEMLPMVKQPASVNLVRHRTRGQLLRVVMGKPRVGMAKLCLVQRITDNNLKVVMDSQCRIRPHFKVSQMPAHMARLHLEWQTPPIIKVEHLVMLIRVVILRQVLIKGQELPAPTRLQEQQTVSVDISALVLQ